MTRARTMACAVLAAAALGAAAPAASAAGGVASLAAVERQARAASARIQRQEDRLAVENLQMIYGFYFDKKLWDQVADLFARDGTMELDRRGVFVGPASIRRSLEMFGGPALKTGELFNHMQLQPVVDVAPDGETARGRWHAFIQTGVVQKSGEWAEGVYENDYVKEGGVWKIRALRYCQTMRADYDQGWARSAEPMPGPDPAFPPDRPSTNRCQSYPNAAGPPFHFPNPAARGR